MPCRPFRLALLLLVICLPAGLDARSNGDFLVVQHAERLLVYNKYQQQATEAERKLLAPFVPMRIVKTDVLLADGFTRSMQVEIGDETFFLLKDKGGKLTSSGPLGFEQTFRNTTLLLDTVLVLTARSVRLSPINAHPVYLTPGEKVQRIFRYQDDVYCGRTGAQQAYGWASLMGRGDGRTWKVLAAPGSSLTSVPPLIAEQVRSRVEEMNRLLARLFGHFNTETHQQKETPRWEVEASRSMISCRLQGAPPGEHFERSTLYLVKDLENIVLGANLAVLHAPGRIDIRRP